MENTKLKRKGYRIIKKNNSLSEDRNQISKRLEIIKSSIAIEDEEIIELQIMKLQKLDIDDDINTIITYLEAMNYAKAINDIETYLARYNGVVEYVDSEIQGLKLELKSLESKLQELIEQKTEYLNDIEEFNREYNLHLGELIKDILNLKKEILYKQTINQQKEKEKYQEDIQTFQDTKDTITELKSTIDELKTALESIDEDDESYEELSQAFSELKEELEKLESELELQEEELEKTKEFIEDETIKQEYEEVNSHYEEFESEYEHIKESFQNSITLNDEEKKELKSLYKKAARLCHPDIVPDELKVKAHELMQKLNEAYGNKDISKVKEILNELQNGTNFEVSSETIEDKELLKTKIKEYKKSIKDIESDIEDIKEDETYQTIVGLYDWNEYFKNLKNELQSEKEILEKEAKETIKEKAEIERKKVKDKNILEWMETLWNWAKKNNLNYHYFESDNTHLGFPLNTEDLIKMDSLEISDAWTLDPDPIPLDIKTPIPDEICNLRNLKKLRIMVEGNKFPTKNQEKWLKYLLYNDCKIEIWDSNEDTYTFNTITTESNIFNKEKIKTNLISSENSSYTKHIQSIENIKFERIRKYCENMSKKGDADEMQKYLGEKGKIYKALMYSTLEILFEELNDETITLYDWGCGQGIASMLVLDYIKEKQLDIKVSDVILIDEDAKSLSRAIAQIEALSQNSIKFIPVKSDDNKICDTIKSNKNNIVINLFANDNIPTNFWTVDYEIFDESYFLCVSNENKELLDEIYENINSSLDIQDLSIRDGKIGRFEKFERIFEIRDNLALIDIDKEKIPF